MKEWKAERGRGIERKKMDEERWKGKEERKGRRER